MILGLEHVFFAYPENKKSILSDVSFTVMSGSYISILGDNGSGKTTLIKLILGILAPQKGAIMCKAKRIGYVPQQKPSFFQLPLTVQELLDTTKKTLNITSKQATTDALALLGVGDKKNALLGSLSGGELQRVFISQALLGEPELLILDEPSTAVDIQGQENLYRIISNLHKAKGITIIAVEHNLVAAMRNSTEIFHIHDKTGHLCSPHQYAKEYLNTAKLSIDIGDIDTINNRETQERR